MRQGPQAARGSATVRRLGRPGRTHDAKAGIGVRLPANHNEISGEVAKPNADLDLRVLCGASHAEAHVSVRGSVERAPCGLNVSLPDTNVKH